MKKLFLLAALSIPMLLTGCGSTSASAQTPEPTAEVEQTSGSETEQTEEELAPLEVVDLPEPVLSTGEHGERQTFLAEGEPAPWAGVLLNPEAVAFIISQYEAQWERARAALERQRDSDWNRLQLEVGRLRLRLETQEQQHNIIVDGLNREVSRLIQIHEDYVEEQNGGFWNSDFGQVLQYGLIIVGSAAVGLVVGYLAGALQ